MTFYSNVQPARRRTEKHQPWECKCVIGYERTTTGRVVRRRDHFQINPGYLSRCYDCGTARITTPTRWSHLHTDDTALD